MDEIENKEANNQGEEAMRRIPRTWTEDEKMKMFNQITQLRSEMSLAAACRQFDIAAPRYFEWKRNLAKFGTITRRTPGRKPYGSAKKSPTSIAPFVETIEIPTESDTVTLPKAFVKYLADEFFKGLNL